MLIRSLGATDPVGFAIAESLLGLCGKSLIVVREF